MLKHIMKKKIFFFQNRNDGKTIIIRIKLEYKIESLLEDVYKRLKDLNKIYKI